MGERVENEKERMRELTPFNALEHIKYDFNRIFARR